MQECIIHRYPHMNKGSSTPTHWSKSQVSLFFHFTSFSRVPWLCTLQKYQVGSGWQACDHSPLLPQQPPGRQGSARPRARGSQGEAGWAHSFPAPSTQEEACTPSKAPVSSHKIPRGLALPNPPDCGFCRCSLAFAACFGYTSLADTRSLCHPSCPPAHQIAVMAQGTKFGHQNWQADNALISILCQIKWCP